MSQIPRVPLLCHHRLQGAGKEGIAAGGETEARAVAGALLAGKGTGRRVGCLVLTMVWGLFSNGMEKAGGKMEFSFGRPGLIATISQPACLLHHPSPQSVQTCFLHRPIFATA